MSAFSLSTRYAKALLQLAEEKGKLEEVYKDMKELSGTFQSSNELRMMFKSPIVTADKKLHVVKLLFEGKVSPLLYQFMVLVIKKGRESFFNEITVQFVNQYNELRDITPVTITSAVKLDAELVQRIVTRLKTNEKLGTVELHEVIDESLIGGFVIRYGDKMLDDSVSTELVTMKDIIEDTTYSRKYT